MRYSIRKSWEPRRIRLYSFNCRRRKIKEAITKKIQKGKRGRSWVCRNKKYKKYVLLFISDWLLPSCICMIH